MAAELPTGTVTFLLTDVEGSARLWEEHPEPMRRARWTCAVTTARPSGPGRCPREDRYPRFATARNLVDVVLGRAANGSPGEVGLRTVELLEAAYRSAAKEGQPVGVESDVPAHPRQR